MPHHTDQNCMFCTLVFVLVSKWNGIKMTKRNLNGEIPSGELDVSSYLMETSLVSLNQPSYQILSLYKRNGSIIGMIWLATLTTGFMDHGSKDQHFVQPSTHSSRTCHPQEVFGHHCQSVSRVSLLSQISRFSSINISLTMSKGSSDYSATRNSSTPSHCFCAKSESDCQWQREWLSLSFTGSQPSKLLPGCRSSGRPFKPGIFLVRRTHQRAGGESKGDHILADLPGMQSCKLTLDAVCQIPGHWPPIT